MSLPAPAPRSVPRLLAAASIVAALGGELDAGGAGRAAADDRVVHTRTLSAGQSLALVVTNGTVRVIGEPGRTDVRLEIVRRAPTPPALAGLPIVLTDTAAGPRLEVTQADGGADAALRADITVTAPADVRLDPITIAEGGLELRHLHGAVRATVARGGIRADDDSGVLRLETTLGPVEVTGARLTAGGLFRLRTFNGDVRLALREALTDARVLALALNGSIASAVPLVMKEGWGPRWGEATIGQPDRVVSIDVVTGAIRIEAPDRR